MSTQPDRVKAAYEDQVRELREKLASRQRELAILSEIAARIHGTDTVAEILAIALEEIQRHMPVGAGWIFLGDQRDQQLRLAASRGVSPAYLERIEAEGLGECLCPEVFWSGHTMLARNTKQCPRMPDITDDDGSTSHACIPLRFEGSARGVLNIAARAGQQFASEQLQLLETVGYQIAIAVERARHMEAESRRNREARALAAITKASGGSLDASTVIAAIGETAEQLFGIDQSVLLLGSNPRRMRVAHVRGQLADTMATDTTFDLEAQGWSVSIEALKEGRVLRVEDSSTDRLINRDVARRLAVGSAVVAPLPGPERPLGVLVLTRKSPYSWTDAETEIAETLATQAALALERARLYDEARRALRDLRSAQARIIRNEKMAVLGTFASGLAHEVRNPLNSISLQLSVLDRRAARLETPLAEQLASITGIIRQEVHRLDELVSDFLLFSRTSHIQHRAANLGDLLDEVVSLMRPEADAARVEVERRSAATRPEAVPMDTPKLKQVVINLVRNAIEAMPDGGRVVVEDGIEDDHAFAIIEDTGPGLPEEVDVFQLFVTTKPRGTGLGLSIAQQIVLDHGGELSVDSKPGKGARFTIWLPLSHPDERPGGDGQ